MLPRQPAEFPSYETLDPREALDPSLVYPHELGYLANIYSLDSIRRWRDEPKADLDEIVRSPGFSELFFDSSSRMKSQSEEFSKLLNDTFFSLRKS